MKNKVLFDKILGLVLVAIVVFAFYFTVERPIQLFKEDLQKAANVELFTYSVAKSKEMRISATDKRIQGMSKGDQQKLARLLGQKTLAHPFSDRTATKIWVVLYCGPGEDEGFVETFGFTPEELKSARADSSK